MKPLPDEAAYFSGLEVFAILGVIAQKYKLPEILLTEDEIMEMDLHQLQYTTDGTSFGIVYLPLQIVAEVEDTSRIPEEDI